MRKVGIIRIERMKIISHIVAGISFLLVWFVVAVVIGLIVAFFPHRTEVSL
jgi:hypothetical protein